MNDVNALIEELRALITTPDFDAAERFKVAVNRVAGFLADMFGAEKSEVAFLWQHGDSLSFIWP